MKIAPWVLTVFVAMAAFALFPIATAKRIRDRIYQNLVADKYCFRRFNGTHQFGCTSDLDGNVGVVHLVENAEDVDWIIDKGPHAPYVAAFLPKTFSKDNLVKLAKSAKLSGAVLLADPSAALPEAGYSDDRSCPNRDSSLYSKASGGCDADNRPWNPFGKDGGLAFADFNFPVLIVRDNETVEQITRECYEEFNRPTGPNLTPREWPLCALELKSHMYAATDTETCLRRGGHTNLLTSVKYCDRMGDRNTFLFMRERNVTESAVTVVGTRLDTLTMFDTTERGADSPTSGIVTLLETARLLSKQLPDFSGNTQNILFAFFHGESFDYIGSSRFVYDVKEGLFPDKIDASKFSRRQQPVLGMDEIDLFLEVGQVYNKEASENLYLHTDGNSIDRQGVLDHLIQIWGDDIKRASGKHLPPSSAQSYLKEVGRQKTAVLLTDFDQQYSNRYYHSIYDDASNVEYSHNQPKSRKELVERISRTAENLATFLWQRASSSSSVPSFSANKTLVNELLKCYLETASCPLFFAASNRKTPPFTRAVPPNTLPWSMYVGVDRKQQEHGILTTNVLAYLTGEEEPDLDESACRDRADLEQNVYDYVFLRGETVPDWWEGDLASCNASYECGHCFKTLSFRRMAVSPAFVIEDYDYADSRYSAWAESMWKEVGGRMFLKASPSLERFGFVVGVLVTLVSFVVVYWVERNSTAIFPLDASPMTPSPPTSSSSAVVANAAASDAAAAASQAVAL